jgi:hypothetical protein
MTTQKTVTPTDVELLLATKLTGVVYTQPCVISESDADDASQFDGNMVIDFGNRTVGDVCRRAVSNIVIGHAPTVRKNIMKYRGKKTINIDAPAPGRRDRGTPVTTQSDVETYLGNIDADAMAAIVANVAARRDA